MLVAKIAVDLTGLLVILRSYGGDGDNKISEFCRADDGDVDGDR